MEQNPRIDENPKNGWRSKNGSHQKIDEDP